MVETGSGLRPPLQERSRASLERAVAAGTELLAEKGYDAFTLAEVSRRANVSIGSIYARVSSKENLIRLIHARAMDEMRDEQARFADAPRWQALSTRELVVQAVGELAEHCRANAPLLRAFMHRGAVDEVIAARGSQTSTELAEIWKALLLTRRGELARDDPELAVDVCWRVAYSAFARRVMYGPTFESSYGVDWDELAREIGAMCAAYLLG
jgi:AcrR family transcriptional regulator